MTYIIQKKLRYLENCGHGFGMRSIVNIVNKYHGEITYDYSYRYFSVQVKL